jgi:Ca2+-binding EF-hand superfamily protein
VVKFLGLKMTEEEVQALFDQFDEDKSGSIEFDEFLILISKKASQYLLYLIVI